MNLKRLLWLAIVLPSTFVVAATFLSLFGHDLVGWEGVTHAQEHVALAVVMVLGIVPFSFLMINIFRRIHIHTLDQNQALSQRTREMEALLKVGRAVESSLELDRIVPAALEAILEITTAEAAEVWLSDPQEGVISLRYHKGQAPEAFLEVTRFHRGEGYPGIVAESGEPILVHDLPADPRFLRNSVKQAGFSSYYAIPLRRPDGGTNGVLAVSARDPKALKREDELRLLQLMVDHISAAVENSRLHEEVRALAIMAERDRLAKEMHDGLAQVLGYVNTKAQAVKELLAVGQVEAASRHMDQLEEAARETYDDVREAILSLSGNNRRQSLVESLQTYVERFGELSGIRAELAIEGAVRPFNPGVEVQLLRIAQEALANARKHAQARSIRLTLSFSPEGCRLLVEDDGRGFDPSHMARGPWPHLGLQSMRERAASIGAGLSLDTAPGSGTRVILDLPGGRA